MRLTGIYRIVVAFVLTAALAGPAAADCQRLVSSNDPAQPNAFTLSFPPEYGGTRQANITYSEITLETCPDTATARFVDYYQEAESLTLPGDVPTGELTILITLSQPQTFNPATGQFTTDDFYAIYFTGDLSAYGISSPFYLPGMSDGVVTYETPTTGTIAMNWAGDAALPNPFDPGQPIPFSYTCQVNTRFSVDPGCALTGCEAGDVNGDCSVGLDDLTALLANYGTSGPRVRPGDGDTDGDLDVDLHDLSGLLSQFGADCN